MWVSVVVCCSLFAPVLLYLPVILRTDYEGLVLGLFVLDVALEEVTEHRSLLMYLEVEPQRPQDPRHGSG